MDLKFKTLEHIRQNMNYSQNSKEVDKTEKQPKNSIIVLLPTQLVNYRNKNFFVSAVTLFFGFGFSIYVCDAAFLLLSALFAAYFLWKGASVSFRYHNGRIAELTAICTGIMPSFYRDRFTVTFAVQSEADDFVYYKFVVPCKRNQEDFIIGARYVIYFDRNAVRSLLGYLLLSSGIA